MKNKIIIVQWVLILGLIVMLLNRFISWGSRDAIIRATKKLDNSTIEYVPPPPPKISAADLTALVKGLRNNFAPTIDQITDDIFLARGYMLGSIMMVNTEDGLVLIDSGENKEIAKEILKKFKKKADKTVKYIILTHGHLDHVLGLPSLVEKETEIIASKICGAVMDKDLRWLEPYHRWARASQFGNVAEEFALKRWIDLPYNPDDDWTILKPTITFDSQYSLTFGEKTFEIYLAPGETEGQSVIWIPEEKALFCGDLYYESFPNLSSPLLEPRPVKEWIESLKLMASFAPEHLIPSHTRAISGNKEIQQVLADRITAIQLVYDQTIAAINAGKSVEEAVAEITLPPELMAQPQLKELYGTVAWSVRGIYQREKGWYNGYGSGLNPLQPTFRAQELVELCGGSNRILQRAVDLQKAGDHQLVCELCDIVIAANPDDPLARIIKSYSLDYLSMSSNGNMMGFYRAAASLERKAANYNPNE